jgi:hypothetical protein
MFIKVSKSRPNALKMFDGGDATKSQQMNSIYPETCTIKNFEEVINSTLV